MAGCDGTVLHPGSADQRFRRALSTLQSALFPQAEASRIRQLSSSHLCSQSPIGVVKCNHALNFASRIKKCVSRRYEVERASPHSGLPDPCRRLQRVEERACQRETFYGYSVYGLEVDCKMQSTSSWADKRRSDDGQARRNRWFPRNSGKQ